MENRVIAFVIVLAILTSLGTVSYYSAQFSEPEVVATPIQSQQTSGFLVVNVLEDVEPPELTVEDSQPE